MKKCQFCNEEIQDDAIKCRYCGEWPEKTQQFTAMTEPIQNVTEQVHSNQTEEMVFETMPLPKKSVNDTNADTNQATKNIWRSWVGGHLTWVLGFVLVGPLLIIGYRNLQSSYVHHTSTWQRYNLSSMGVSVDLPAKAEQFNPNIPNDAMAKFKKVDAYTYTNERYSSTFFHYIFADNFEVDPNGLEQMANGAVAGMKANGEKEAPGNSTFNYEMTTKTKNIVRVKGSFSRNSMKMGSVTDSFIFDLLYIMAENQVWAVLIIHDPNTSYSEKDAKRIQDSILINKKWRFDVSSL